ncbi:MAG TPA: hypothetical protein VGX76_10440 [Pirellulales bacterium]|jgi:hypothetical protein|nr:hypothetical protein [Pirellulales bacterium]
MSRSLVSVPPIANGRSSHVVRRSRRVIGWACGSFIAFHLALALAGGPPRLGWRDPEFAAKLACLRARLREDSARPLVLMLGSSRTSVGLAPRHVASGTLLDGCEPLVFNLGMAGHGPVQELMALRRLLRWGIRPRHVLVEVHPALLHQEPGGYSEEAWMPDEHLDDDDRELLGRYWSRPHDRPRGQLLAKCERFDYLRRTTAGWLENRWWYDCAKWIDAHGWWPWPVDGPSDDDRRRATDRTRLEYAAAMDRFRVTALADCAVRELLDVCGREGIHAALYLMPEGTSFQDWYPPGARGEIEAYLAELSSEYGASVFDATTWCADDDFADGHHLLREPATHFSERFGREVVRPWLAAPADRALLGAAPGANARQYTANGRPRH